MEMGTISMGGKEETELEEAGFADWMALRGQEGKKCQSLAVFRLDSEWFPLTHVRKAELQVGRGGDQCWALSGVTARRLDEA